MKKYAYSILLAGITLWYCSTMRSEEILIPHLNTNSPEFNNLTQNKLLEKPAKTFDIIKKLKK